MLQFGHGFDAVETKQQLEVAGMVMELQFGHGFDAVETRRSPRRPHGPGPRFNSATALMPWKRMVAAARRSRTEALQFGHGFDAVETMNAEGEDRQYHEASIRPRL